MTASQGNDAGHDEDPGHLADPANVLHPFRFGKTKIETQAMTNVVDIEHEGPATALMQALFHGIGEGRSAGALGWNAKSC